MKTNLSQWNAIAWQRFLDAALTRDAALLMKAQTLAVHWQDCTRVAVLTQNADDLLIAILAASLAKADILLPPSTAPDMLAYCDGQCDAWLSDLPLSFQKPHHIGRISEWDITAIALSDKHRCASDKKVVASDCHPINIHLMSSGSTGEPKIFTHALPELCGEVLGFAHLMTTDTVRSSVSLQHRFGLTCHFLYPVMYGVAYQATAAELPDNHLCARDGGMVQWVTSPTFLQSLAAHPNLSDWRGQVSAILTAGGKLNETLRAQIENTLAVTITDIYGSSETGVMAARRDEDCFHWLSVVSATVGNPETHVALPWMAHPVLLGDRLAVQAKGGFVIQGRLDNIIKIAEKRIDLDVLNHQLQQDMAIADSHLCQIPERTHLFAWIALTEEGIQELREKGRKALAQRLAAQLAQSHPKVAVPRQWRFTTKLPRNSQSKLPKAAVEKAMREPPLTPHWYHVEQDAEQLTAKGIVPVDLQYLRGHFDHFGIVPGVVEVKWVCEIASEWLGHPLSPQTIENLKFQKMLRPNDPITITLTYNASRDKILFTCTNAQGICASGRIVLAAAF